MKLRRLLLSMCVAAVSLCVVAQGQSGGTVPLGFLAHPLLAKDGYKAEIGSFSIGVGQGALQNLDHLTDNDPNNFSAAVNLAQVTLGADSWVKIVPDDQWFTDNNKTAPEYGPGTEVGFMMGDNGSNVTVLDLSVVSTMVVYYYYKGEHVGTSQLKYAGQTALIDLNLIQVKDKESVQKMTAVCPADVDRFDGIGFGFTTVDAAVGSQLAVYYGYIDDYVDVPIIQKYFSNVTSETHGMVTGAKNLINNDLKDGATTAVLNIGGAYYDVYPGREIPAGVEVGFVMTAGEVLNLDLGGAVRLRTYDQNGNELDQLVNVNVVGLGVAGGGKLRVSMLTSRPCWRIRLERITVINLDLGATVVHYAYAHLPQYPPVDIPFQMKMDIIPKTTTTHSASDHRNRSNNFVLIHNLEESPLKIESESANSVWGEETITGKNSVDNGHYIWGADNNVVRLSLFRQQHYADGRSGSLENLGIIYVIHYKHLEAGTLYKRRIAQNHYYWEYWDATDGWGGDWGELPLKADNKTLDFDGLEFHLHEEVSNLAAASTTITSTDYVLMLAPTKNKGTNDYKDASKCKFLSSDGVTYPQVKPAYELAGGAQSTADDDKTPTMETGKTGHYVVLEMPLDISSRMEARTYDLYHRTNSGDTRVCSYKIQSPKQIACYDYTIGTRTITSGSSSVSVPDTTVTADVSAQYMKAYKHKNGVFMVLADWIAQPETYYLVANGRFNSEYTREINNRYLGKNWGTAGDVLNHNYGCTPATATAQTSGAAIEYKPNSLVYCTRVNGFTRTSYYVNFGQARGHVFTDRDEVLYNQWYREQANPATQNPTAKTAAAAGSVSWTEGDLSTWHNNTTKIDDTNSPEYAELHTRVKEHPDDNADHDELAVIRAHSDMQAEDNLEVQMQTRCYLPIRPVSFPDAEGVTTYIVAETPVEDIVVPNSVRTGVDGIHADDVTAPVRYYDLQGREVTTPEAGMYIRVSGGKAQKVIFR